MCDIIGPENNKHGWANFTQVTGTAAWMDIAATQYLLGLRPELAGLRIVPLLPGVWPGFSASRRYRGCQLAFEVRRARAGESPGVSLDGRALEDNLVPAAALHGRAAARVVCILASRTALMCPTWQPIPPGGATRKHFVLFPAKFVRVLQREFWYNTELVIYTL